MKKPAPTRLEVSASTLLAVFESISDQVFVKDLDGRYVMVNRAGAALLSRPVEEILGRTDRELWAEADVKRIAAADREVIASSRTGVFATDLTVKGITRRFQITETPYRDPAGTVIGIIGIGHEVNDLLSNEAQFRLLVQDVEEYAIYTVDRAGRIVSWNSGAERMKGYRAEEVIGHHFSLFYTREDRKRRWPEQLLAMAKARGRIEDEGWRIRKDGSRFWATLVATALYDKNHELTGFVKVARDLTDRKRFEERLEAIIEVMRAILAENDVDSVLTLIAQRARELASADSAAIGIPEPNEASLRWRVTVGWGVDVLKGMALPMDRSILGNVFQTRESIVIENASVDPRVHPVVRKVGFGPALFVPLAVGDHALGAMLVANRRRGPSFTPHDLTLLEIFATQASVAVEYGRLQRESRRLVVLEDRERIARELHDGIIQGLFGVGMSIKAGMLIPNASADVRDHLTPLLDEIDQLIRDLRRYIHGLRPESLERQFGPALRHLTDEFQHRTGVAVLVDLDPYAASRVGLIAIDLLQVVREALSNVARHAQASTCRITLQVREERAILTIADDGKGFRLDNSAGEGEGLGNIRDRIAAIGGAVRLEPHEGQGTTIEVSVPI